MHETPCKYLRVFVGRCKYLQGEVMKILKGHLKLVGLFVISALLYPCGTGFVFAQPPETRRRVRPPAPPPLPVVTWDELQPQIGGPTLITLHAKEMSAFDVVDELNRQMPIKMRIDAPYWDWQKKPRNLTADYEAQPFWDVLFDIEEKMKMRFYKGNEEELILSPYVANHASISRSGPGVFELLRGDFSRTTLNYAIFHLDITKPSESLTYDLRIYLDPKLRHLGDAKIQLKEAIDDKGQSLRKDNWLNPPHDGVLFDTKIQLQPLATRGQKLQRLRGTYHGVLALQQTEWEVPDILNARNVEKIFGDEMRVELQEIKKVGGDYQATLTWSQTGKEKPNKMSTGHFLTDFGNIYDNLRLVDANGNDLIRGDIQRPTLDFRQAEDKKTENKRTDTLIFVFHPSYKSDASQNSGTPVKLLLRYNFDWRELVVPFEFKDIPLP